MTFPYPEECVLDFARNNLDLETSPYLLQHAANPVHWQPWGPAVLAHAKAAGKPVLLSVGYAACHWCHVMAHESFEDAKAAAVMNELFVNIKVDREERPDIDAIYQNALALLGEQGGWPLTMFLTPEGEPFWGGTYFPPEARWGRPAFADLLRSVARVFQDDKATIDKNRTQLLDGLGRLSAREADGGEVPEITPDFLTKAARPLLREVDPVEGGIGGAPKFPQPYNLTFLWRAYLRTGGAMFRDAVTLTLDKMSQGGIYDHLGGGYARYSTDARWLAPHFEKMLYDNAQLLEVLNLVHAETGSGLYEARIRETVGWVLREMIAEGGGFASTQDADSEGEEGRFYVWTEAEVDAVLGAGADAFKRAYDVSAAGNWEGHTILNRSARPALGTPAAEAGLAAARARLFEARERRVKPGWDDKVLADWNGMMIAALADLGARFGEMGWIAAAVRAFDFICDRLQAGDRLRHAFRAGKLSADGFLDDHAHMARAALVLHEVTGERRYLDRASAWSAVLDRHFWDRERGGYFFTADDAEALIVRVRHAHDNAVPAGNGIMLGVLARLHAITGQRAYRDRADTLLRAFAPEIGRNSFPFGTLLGAAETLHRPVQVAIIGDRGAADTGALLAACRTASCPDRVISVVAPGSTLPEGHPAVGKNQVGGKATAYVCIGETCSLPLTDPSALRDEMPVP